MFLLQLNHSHPLSYGQTQEIHHCGGMIDPLVAAAAVVVVVVVADAAVAVVALL